jgi:hypothetical protein
VREELIASQELGKLPEVQEPSYESRWLEIPGLNLKAFWLAGQQVGSIDYIVPFSARPSQPSAPETGSVLDSGRVPLKVPDMHTLPDFLASIRPLAARNLKMPAGYGA